MPQSSEDRLLYLIKSRGPQTTGTIADRLTMSTVGARKHLTRLEADGLVRFEERRGGVGRPERVWTLTDKGHARFPDAHSDLTLELLGAVKAVFGDTGLERIVSQREGDTLKSYTAALKDCRTPEDRIRTLAEIRSREGYMAEWHLQDDGSYLLAENHCPICAAAWDCQGLCRSELTIFRTVLGEDVTVERTEHIIAGARRCAYRIAPHNNGSSGDTGSSNSVSENGDDHG